MHFGSFPTLKKPAKIEYIFIFLLSFNFLCWNSAFANNLEYKIKAVLAFKIMSYIQWPPATFNADENTFKLGILGDDAVLAVFKSLEGKEIGGRKISVEQIRNLGNLKSFNSVFISQQPRKPWQEVLTALKGSNTLTLGDIDRFAESGGIIGFYNIQDKIRFLINREAAENSGLKINAQLFRVGKLVGN